MNITSINQSSKSFPLSGEFSSSHASSPAKSPLPHGLFGGFAPGVTPIPLKSDFSLIHFFKSLKLENKAARLSSPVKSPLARRDFRVPSARTPSSIEFSFSSERPPASSLPSRRRQQWRGGVASTPCLRNSPPRRVLLCVGASSASPANSPRRSPTSALRPAPASSVNLAAERRHRLLLPLSAATCSCSAEVFVLRRRSSVAQQPRPCCRRDPQLLRGSSSAPSTLAVARYKAVTWSLMG
ncbi:uncharacterized protein LOC125189542 [Salvia hispanica]|uniref:uncharacterized protein LOC125189542 n=1 Tax=Salvia hispanica TaxID=49212 RepID=UPI0020094DB7|nr:uncharacterized protein LOC125189542 [Salvia hispanica]